MADVLFWSKGTSIILAFFLLRILQSKHENLNNFAFVICFHLLYTYFGLYYCSSYQKYNNKS